MKMRGKMEENCVCICVYQNCLSLSLSVSISLSLSISIYLSVSLDIVRCWMLMYVFCIRVRDVRGLCLPDPRSLYLPAQLPVPLTISEISRIGATVLQVRCDNNSFVTNKISSRYIYGEIGCRIVTLKSLFYNVKRY